MKKTTARRRSGRSDGAPRNHATRKKSPMRLSYDTSTGAGQKRLMQESVGLEYVPPRRIEAAPGDYGADPLGTGADGVFRWRMVPSGDIVDKAEHDRRLARGAKRHHATKKSPAQLDREIAEALERRGDSKTKSPRIVDVEAATPAGYRWLRQHAHGATLMPKGFAVTDEAAWAESLRAANAKEI